MTGPELSQRRSRAGLSVDELAEALNRHVDEVAAWEQIPGTLPRAVDRDVEWILASAERGRAFEAAGIPVCPWVTERERELDARDSKALEVWITQSEAHAKTCDVCQRREAFGRTLPPLPPFPMSPQLRLLASVAGTIQRLPGWLRPAAVGAILIGGLTIVRAILLLVLRRAAPSLELLLTVLAAHRDVAECAVVGVADEIKGEIPLGLIVLKAGVRRPADVIAEELVAMVRERIGPVAAFRTAVVVQRLPKTRSGKILRGTVKKIADASEYRVPATIDDPASLAEIAAALATVGYPRR